MIFLQDFSGATYDKFLYETFRFDNLNKYVTVTVPDISDDTFVSLWFYPTSTQNSALLSSRYVTGANNYGWSVRLNDTGTVSLLRGQGTGSLDEVITTETYEEDKWNHIAFSVDSVTGNVEHILNEVTGSGTVTTGSVVFDAGTTNTFLGTDEGESNQYQGDMNQPIIGDSTLTEASLDALSFGRLAIPYAALPLEILTNAKLTYYMNRIDSSLTDITATSVEGEGSGGITITGTVIEYVSEETL